MNKSLALAIAILFTITPLSAPAQDGEAADQAGAAPPPAPAGGTSTGNGIRSDAALAKQGVKNTAREAGHGIKHGVKNGAREVKQGVKSGAAKVKRALAVAQCNDGAYSYTHHLTCNHHGGVRQQLR